MAKLTQISEVNLEAMLFAALLFKLLPKVTHTAKAVQTSTKILKITILKNYKQATEQTPSYDIADSPEEKTEPQPEGQAEPQPELGQLDDGSSADSPKQP